MLHHRVAAVLALAAAATLAFVVVTSTGHATPPGASFSWASPSPASSGAPTSRPLPTASPTAAGNANTLGGLQFPFAAMLQQLNTETRDTAVGQYSILREIGNAIRDQLVRFLNWISGGR